MIKRINRRKENGQGLVEYALILSLVALIVIFVGGLLGGSVQRVYAQVLGSFGFRGDSNPDILAITSAQCWYNTDAQGNITSINLWAAGTRNTDVIPDVTNLLLTADTGEQTTGMDVGVG